MNEEDYDPLDLDKQEESSARTKKDQRLAAKIEREDWKWLMRTRQGRRVAWRLLERAGVYRLSYQFDEHTAFREGSRNIGLMILNALHSAAPESYALMLEEQRSDERDSN
jgi:hypothetical protein